MTVATASALGALLLGVGTLVGALVTWAGKRGENALSGYSSLTDDLQEERADLRAQITERDGRVAELAAQLAELASLRAADQAEIARLRALVIQLGGDQS